MINAVVKPSLTTLAIIHSKASLQKKRQPKNDFMAVWTGLSPRCWLKTYCRFCSVVAQVYQPNHSLCVLGLKSYSLNAHLVVYHVTMMVHLCPN